MRDNHYGLAMAFPKVEEKLVDLGLGLRVEIPGGLISEKYSGIIDKSPGDGNPLLFTTREFRRFMIHSLAESHFL